MSSWQKKVQLGIDRVQEPNIHALLAAGRLGVISAASGISSDYRFPLDILNEQFTVSALFAPEHGPRGMLGPGERVSGGTDVLTGLPVYSLFEDFFTSTDENEKDRAYMPHSEALGKIDAMVFDMQDAGSRYFTYASTLFYVMRACTARHIPLILLDRPNPLGGETVEGNCSDPACHSFIGLTSVPIRHGMTLGELARFYNGTYAIACELYVVELKGWERSMYYDDTGLPFVKPSPNLPTMESLLVYNGTCLFAGTNVSEGRGTTTPFTTVGAPYIDPIRLSECLNADSTLHGVRFSPAFFIPAFSKNAGEKLCGVTLHVTDKRALEPVRLGVTMMRTVQSMYPNDFAFRAPNGEGRWHIDLASGNSDLRTSNESIETILHRWNTQAQAFRRDNSHYLLY